METKMCRFGKTWIQPHAPPPVGGFLNFIFVAENCRPSCPSICSYWLPPEKIVYNSFPLVFHRKFCCVHVPYIIGNLKHKKTASWNKISIKFLIWKWTVSNARTNTRVTPCQKNATYFNILFRSINKNYAWRGAVLQDTCGLPDLDTIPTQMYKLIFSISLRFHLYLTKIAFWTDRSLSRHLILGLKSSSNLLSSIDLSSLNCLTYNFNSLILFNSYRCTFDLDWLFEIWTDPGLVQNPIWRLI